MIDLQKAIQCIQNDLKNHVCLKGNPKLPKTENEHNALDDAKLGKEYVRILIDFVRYFNLRLHIYKNQADYYSCSSLI